MKDERTRDRPPALRSRRSALAGLAALPTALAGATLAGGARAQAGEARQPAIVAPLAAGARYRIVFADDFDDDRLARLNEDARPPAPGAIAWRSRYRQPRKDVINKEKQIYVDAAFAGTGDQPLGVQPFAIADGRLVISADRADPVKVAPRLWNYQYTSGCITTELTHWQKYGYFEIRARMPIGRGFWPTFWLLPKRDAWPPEIDVFEASGTRPDQIHLAAIETTAKDPRNLSGWIPMPRKGRIDQFHVYAVEWTPERITWYVDETKMFEVRNHKIHEEMYLLANLALGSLDPAGWIPDPGPDTPFPGRFEIDYIRAWQR